MIFHFRKKLQSEINFAPARNWAIKGIRNSNIIANKFVLNRVNRSKLSSVSCG